MQNYISDLIIYLRTHFMIKVFVQQECNMWNYKELHGIRYV